MIFIQNNIFMGTKHVSNLLGCSVLLVIHNASDINLRYRYDHLPKTD